MRIAITGASGLVGRALTARLEAAGHQITGLGRAPRKGQSHGMRFAVWDPEKGNAPAEALDGSDAVVHLAGESVAQRWNPEVKRRIRESRVDGTRRLVEGLRECAVKPKVLVSASAVGYYGDRGADKLHEHSAPGKGFLPEVCVEWEREARQAEKLGIRTVVVRVGVVLSRHGGALERMLPPFRLGLGGRLGSGEHYMPWIHVDDLTGILQWAIDNPVRGAVNGVAPNAVTNAEFARALGRALRRPAILPVPKAAVRLLFGEMADIVFDSQRVFPRAAHDGGYRFQHPEIFAALKDLVG